MPADLMHLMWHKDIKTTMTFYAGHNANATAGACWEALGKAVGKASPDNEQSGTTETAKDPSYEGV